MRFEIIINFEMFIVFIIFGKLSCHKLGLKLAALKAKSKVKHRSVITQKPKSEFKSNPKPVRGKNPK